MAIETHNFDGDSTFGRNVSVGGNFKAMANATVKGNLSVEGWLDAPNIRGVSKGMFSTLEKLNAEYPHPQTGWFALVGNELPAPLYRGEDQVWKAVLDAQGNPVKGGAWSVECQPMKEQVDALQEDMNEAKGDISSLKTGVADEESERISGDAALNAALQQEIADEESERISGDAALNAALQQEIAVVDALQAKVDSTKHIATMEWDDIDEPAETTAENPTQFYEVTHNGTSYGFLQRVWGSILLDTLMTWSKWTGAEWTTPSDKKLRIYVRSGMFGAQMRVEDYSEWAEYLGDVEALNASTLDVANYLKWNGAVGWFNGIVDSGIVLEAELTGPVLGVVYVKSEKKFGARSSQSETLYAKWKNSDVYQSVSGGVSVPIMKKLFYNISERKIYVWNTAKQDLEIASGAAIGNSFNVTNERYRNNEPRQIEGGTTYFDELETAIEYTFAKGMATLGMQMTFALTANSWKTYQYTGLNTQESVFKDVTKWLDMASLSAGVEEVINVNHLYGACVHSTYYNLAYAIEAIKNKETETGIVYRKPGLVITYEIGQYQWETKQFRGNAADFGELTLWSDFGGGGGSHIETKPDPEEGGTDAFSTGGAYTYLPSTLNVDTETEGVVKLKMSNAAGEQVGDEVQFQVGTGGGGGGGTIVSINYEDSPFYGSAGSEMIVKASVMSVTKTAGGAEVSNIIESAQLIDRDTNQVVKSWNLNKASSASPTTFDFLFDVSELFAEAKQARYRISVVDDAGNSGAKNINIVAVDVTITSSQTLNYTDSSVLNVGGAARTLSMYRFANNSSDKGIEAIVEIFLGDEWKELGRSIVTNTWTQSITIDPNNCKGVALVHGAYPIRIHGVDVASGVVGNYLHTTVLCVGMPVGTEQMPTLVALRWYTDGQDGVVKLYDNIKVEYAVYKRGYGVANATIAVDALNLTSEVSAMQNKTYSYSARVQGVASDGSVTAHVSVSESGTVYTSQVAAWKVLGSMLDITEVPGAEFTMVMTNRSNSESSHIIEDNGYTFNVFGCNWSTNGFVKDSFGTPEYGTEGDTGVMALRIAENVTGVIDYKPFDDASIEQNGLAINFKIRKRNMANDSSRLISCISSGFGFWVDGLNVVFTTDNGQTVAKTIKASINDDTVTDICIVIEPITSAPYAGIGVVKMYSDGEEIGTCYYSAGSLLKHSEPISFNGAEGDLYLYHIRAWKSYHTYQQDFNNYILRITDAGAMISEYDFNDVMASQTAEGVVKNRPQANKLAELGLAHFVLCKNANTSSEPDQFPEYLETLDGDKKTTRTLDIYAYFPDRPWQDFKAIGATVSNQGTTSSRRPIKNIKVKLKTSVITLLHSRSEFENDPVALALYDACATNAAGKKVQVHDDSLPTNIITVKVDYSESGGANNGGSTHLFNDLQKALGVNYMTPAQVAYTGGYAMDTSIHSVPCAFFRTDIHSVDATNPSEGYFHAKGNWNEDKGDAKIFGFEGVSGYNKDCLNYGDFVEHVAARNQSIEAFAASVDKSGWDISKVQMLSEFCGPKYKFYRYQGNSWVETTGNMSWNGSAWAVTGDVLNPVECYEMLKYDGLNWLQGCNSVDDLLVLDSEGLPIWLQHYESRYPDDDDLNKLYEDRLKVPYRLYILLRWCQDCNHHLNETHGNITINGSAVSGTTANRLLKFRTELKNYANPYSLMCYKAFIDYLAAVDQESKNSMLGFYLDKDGAVRLYMNHLYDGDTILESDNDCGLTIPFDVNMDTDEGVYQGWDSVLYKQLYHAEAQGGIIIDGVAEHNLTNRKIVDGMRKVSLASGLKPFSVQGLEKYFITDRLKKWPKLVSSFDGERKYIEHSTSAANYFYALHGLGVSRLRSYITRRFEVRDGYYVTGDLYKSVFAMRAVSLTTLKVRIKAAKNGYFGLGVDRADTATDACYLNAGESYELNSGMQPSGSGTMIYVFGADKIAELDISGCSPFEQAFDTSKLVLLKKFIIGGEGYIHTSGAQTSLQTLKLGNMPFLTHVDVRKTKVVTIDAEYCPRLESIKASGTEMSSVVLAQTCPIEELELPDTMTSLTLHNLPKLKYPDGGLTFGGLSHVARLFVRGCESIDSYSLLKAVTDANAPVAALRIEDLNVTANSDALNVLKSKGAIGLDINGNPINESGQCSGVLGVWILSSLMDDIDFEALAAYFPALSLYNSQFNIVMFDDTMSDPQNITNLENNTKGDNYVATGHILRIREKMIPVYGKVENGVFKAKRLNDGNYRKVWNGDDFDYSDQSGVGNDTFMRIPHCWYKGVNDYKDQKKYICWSSSESEPLSTASKSVRKTLSDIIYQPNKSVYIDAVQIGVSTIESEGVLLTTANFNTYRIDVEGMKQVRWPGLNNASVGATFANAEGKLISVFNMAVSHQYFDFVGGEDYVFCDVPEGAKWLYFTSFATSNTMYALAVNSDSIEAIEPDWVENKPSLVGVYEASMDSLTRIRSLSNVNVRTGTNTQTTSAEWQYDSSGRPITTPVSNMNYTCKDLMNLAMRRGAGYQLIDYEQSKFCAILWYSLNGTRNAQTKCGMGKSSGGSTGYTDTIGNADSYNGQVSGNKCLGIESFFACTYEFMDNVAFNVKSWASFFLNKCVAMSGQDTVDYTFRIYDPNTNTERAVHVGSMSEGCIVRVKNGRHCDVLASMTYSDNQYLTYYTDLANTNGSTARVVSRANSHAGASGGLAYAHSYYASSYSYTGCGSRLAFRGAISVEGEDA